MAAWSNDEIERVAEHAYQLHLQGKNQDALTIFEGLIVLDPRNLYCLEALAALYLTLGAPDKTVEYATRALAFSPACVDALVCRCEANLLLGRLSLAQQDLETLSRMNGGSKVIRLAMRVANSRKTSTNLLADATSPNLDR